MSVISSEPRLNSLHRADQTVHFVLGLVLDREALAIKNGNGDVLYQINPEDFALVHDGERHLPVDFNLIGSTLIARYDHVVHLNDELAL